MAKLTNGGYYNAHNHQVPETWEVFREHVRDGLARPEQKARYLTYLLSWCLHHDDALLPTDVSNRQATGERIIADFEDMLEKHMEYLENWKGPKKGKRK